MAVGAASGTMPCARVHMHKLHSHQAQLDSVTVECLAYYVGAEMGPPKNLFERAHLQLVGLPPNVPLVALDRRVGFLFLSTLLYLAEA